MPRSLDILRKSLRTLAPKIPEIRHKWMLQQVFKRDAVTINNFAIKMHYKIFILFRLIKNKYTNKHTG